MSTPGSFPPPRHVAWGLSQQGPTPPPALPSPSRAVQPPTHCRLQHVAPALQVSSPSAARRVVFTLFLRPHLPPLVTSRKTSTRPYPPPPSRGCLTWAGPPSTSPPEAALSPRPWQRALLRKLLTQRVARRPASDVSLESGPGSGGGGWWWREGAGGHWTGKRTREPGVGRQAGPRGRRAGGPGLRLPGRP